MAEDTKTRDNVGDQHDDGLWPDFNASASSSVHEDLPRHFEGEDNLFPDEDASISSVRDGAAVLAENGFGEDTLYPDERTSVVSVQDQLDAGTEDEDAEDDGPPNKSASKGEWEDYAVSRGMTREEAEDANKSDLVEKYSQ